MDKLKGMVHIVLAILIIFVIAQFSEQLAQLQGWGYVGIFVISLLSAATVFIPTPGWAIVIAMSSVLNAPLVGLVAGIGSGLGEITGYVAGSGAKELMENGNIKKYKEWIKKNDLVAVFVLAFIPNPLFDVAGLAAGTSGIPVSRFLAATIAGRICRYVLLAMLGQFSLQYI